MTIEKAYWQRLDQIVEEIHCRTSRSRLRSDRHRRTSRLQYRATNCMTTQSRVSYQKITSGMAEEGGLTLAEVLGVCSRTLVQKDPRRS